MAVGTVSQQLLRLAHAAEVHGLEVVALCPGCKDDINALDCKTCGGEGHEFRMSRPEACGPNCPLLDVRPV
jgi:hypothetical protein